MRRNSIAKVGILICVALLNVDYLVTGGSLALLSYPLFRAFSVWWDFQQILAGNLSLLLSDLALVSIAVILALSLDSGVRRLFRAVQIGSASLFPLGLYVLLGDPGEFRIQFCKLCGPVTNEALLYAAGILLVGSSVALRVLK